MVKPKFTRERHVAPTICAGCGSAASGYHYEAPACGSCKIFFRRSVIRGREYTGCVKDGVCDRDRTLHPCRACRLDRCIRGGMNPLLLLNLTEPENNHVVRHFLRVKEEMRFATPSVAECTFDRIIGALLYLENAHDTLRDSPFDPDPAKFRLDYVIVTQSLMSMKWENLQSSPFGVDPWSREKAWGPGARKCWPLADLLFSIEYMKTFEFFHDLSNHDRKALCRHATIMCSQIKLAFFSHERNSEDVPDGFPHDRELHQVTIQLLRDLELDKKEYVLIKALIICNPAIEGLSMSYHSKLEEERDKYAKALMSYVLASRGPQKGPADFASMIGLVEWLTHLMKRFKDWYVLQKATTYESGKEMPESIVDDVLCY